MTLRSSHKKVQAPVQFTILHRSLETISTFGVISLYHHSIVECCWIMSLMSKNNIYDIKIFLHDPDVSVTIQFRPLLLFYKRWITFTYTKFEQLCMIVWGMLGYNIYYYYFQAYCSVLWDLETFGTGLHKLNSLCRPQILEFLWEIIQ